MLKKKELVRVVNRVLQIDVKAFPSELQTLLEDYLDDRDRLLTALVVLTQCQEYRPLFQKRLELFIKSADPLWKRVTDACGDAVVRKKVCQKIISRLAKIYAVTTVNFRYLVVEEPTSSAVSKKYMATFIQYLPGVEQAVVQHRLLAKNPMTLQETGKRLGISREEVRAAETRAMSRLKAVAMMM